VKPLFILLILIFFKSPCVQAQDTLPRVPAIKQMAAVDKKKRYVIAGVHAATYAGTLAILGAAWYSDYPKTSFHLFNDSKEWLQVDKAGHAWTAYNISNYSARLWRWSGVSERKAALFGGFSSIGYQTILEFLDAHSSGWGWSWADVSANVAGAALYTGQQLAWGNQKVVLKFSAFPQRYDTPLETRADALFGKTGAERLLKDYNGQTYWASVNLHSFFKSSVPGWLNIAVGYGAKGMYGGFKNIAFDENGATLFDRRDIKRMRQWYLSPDIDWTSIKTNKKGVKTLFTLLNMIKVPAPALEWRGGNLKARWLAF
jgi:uncharacterized protein YfiM (DUF2279 family)